MGNFDDIGTGVVEEVPATAAAVWSLVTSARNALIVSWAVMASSVRATRCLLSSISLLLQAAKQSSSHRSWSLSCSTFYRASLDTNSRLKTKKI